MLNNQLNTTKRQKEDTAASAHELAEQKLKLSELRYRRLFETAQDGILILDADTGKITDANPFLKEILGYSQAELLGKELWQIGVFKDIAESKNAFRELQKEGYIRYKDLPLETKDGRSIEVEFVSNVYTVAQEKVIQCNIRDITDRKKIEEAVKSKTAEMEHLSQSQEKTKEAMLNVMEDLEEAKGQIEVEKVKDEAMLASIGEGLIAVDNDRKIMVVNKAAENLLGWKSAELLGKELSMLHLEDEEGNQTPLDQWPATGAAESGKLSNKTYFFIRKDKTRFPIAINVTPIKLGNKIIGAVDIFRDITREREIDRAKSEFVSLASHQLRTPLGIIKWYLEALENEQYFNQAPQAIRKHFEEIYKSNERVLTLVRDLLSVSRIEQGRVKNAPKSVDILLLVTQIVDQMQLLAHKKKIALSLVVHDTQIPAIKIDILRFREVIENLIGNAIEYTKGSGAVVIAIDTKKHAGDKNGEFVLLSVKDKGIGISAPDQKKLYTKFFRAEKAIIQNPEGSGLGLYVVKSYVEGWGGTITAKSKEAKGSTFTVSLPVVQTKNS